MSESRNLAAKGAVAATATDTPAKSSVLSPSRQLDFSSSPAPDRKAAFSTPPKKAIDLKSDPLFSPSPPKIGAQKKRKKPKDSRWSAKSEAGGGAASTGDCAWRYDNKEVSTAVLIEGSPLKLDPVKPDPVFVATLQQQIIQEVRTHTPIVAITRVSAAGSPEEVLNNKGELLARQSKIGIASFFQPGEVVRDEIPPVQPDFFQSEIAGVVKKNHDPLVSMGVRITPQDMQRVLKEKKENGGRRKTSQAQVMVAAGQDPKKASATTYSQRAGVTPKSVKSEWNHTGVAYRFAGEKSQHHKNMKAATQATNTMTLAAVEGLVAGCLKVYPYVDQHSVTRSIPGTQLLEQVDYKIETPDFTLPVAIPGQMQHTPHASTKNYMLGLLAAKMKQNGRDITPLQSSKKKSKDDKKSEPGILLHFKRNHANKENTAPQAALASPAPRRAAAAAAALALDDAESTIAALGVSPAGGAPAFASPCGVAAMTLASPVFSAAGVLSPVAMSLAGTPVVAGISPSGPAGMVISPQVYPVLSPVRGAAAAQDVKAANSQAKLLSPIAAFLAKQKSQVPASPSLSPAHKKLKLRSPLAKLALPQPVAQTTGASGNGIRLFSAATPAPKVPNDANSFLLVTSLQVKR